MMRPRMTIRLAILFFLFGTSMAWSKRVHKPRPLEEHPSHLAAAESKVEPRFAGNPKSSYILEEDDHYPKASGPAEEYLDSEDKTSIKEQHAGQGNEDSDDTIKDDEYDDHSEKGEHKEFKAGGASFDKHLKDHKADKKELENVKQHDMGQKFGGQATKEHKLGKHKEKSKGHKLHGFKNVYHKEEYGDHKTFHDEFLDTDHQHNYDDHHEHQELHGGKFSKGYKHEGKNDKYDKGDEKHEWGKEDYDAQHEGKFDKGAQKSKHRHAVKKQAAHFDGDAQRQKNTVHKVNKGMPPLYPSHGGHHGPHQAQIQPYVPHHNPHQEYADVSPQRQSSHLQKAPYTPQEENAYSNGHRGNNLHSDNGHGNHHSSHSGHHISDRRGEYDPKGEGEYHGRNAHNQQRKLKNEETFVPVIKPESVPRHHEAGVHNHKSHAHSHEPHAHKHESVVHVHDPVAQKYEGHSHNHHHHSHSHKQSVSPHHGIQQYRQPVLQQNSQIQQSLPLTQEKITERLHERPHNHEHKIRYGFQPRNHDHHHHNHNNRFHHNHNSHHLHRQPFPNRQPFPRFSELSHNNQAHSHHHHGPHRDHSHFRQTPSNYQQEVQSQSPAAAPAPAPKEYYANKPTRSEEQQPVQPVNSQAHYE